MTDKGMFEFDDLQGVLSRVADRLDDSFTGIFSKETIERYVKESYDLLAVNAMVTVHLPSLTERFAKDRLRALAQYETKIEKDKPSILFVCVHNAGRSQMAAGFMREIGGDRIEVLSAGSAPKDTINPVAVEAMAEVGIDIANQQPKVLTTEAVQESDAVITMGCGDVCPVFPGKRYEDWVLEDPAGQDIAFVRKVRDEIKSRVEGLLSELLENS